jgi:hypothetical protein
MATQRNPRPAFQSVELDDPIDARLEAKAAEKGIPTLVTPRAEPSKPEEPLILVQHAAPSPRRQGREPERGQSTPRSRMKGLKIELPDYVWIALKIQAAEEMVSLRHLIMTALRAQGISINDADMVEDGRRLRG